MRAIPSADRPWPVAQIPPPALADGAVAAKAWLLELVRAAELREAATIPVAELAERGPALCAALLRAVGSDLSLRPLLPGGQLERDVAAIGALCGTNEPVGVAASVARLRAALAAVLAEALPGLDAATTAALGARLAAVCDVVLEAALRAAVQPVDRTASPQEDIAADAPDPDSAPTNDAAPASAVAHAFGAVTADAAPAPPAPGGAPAAAAHASLEPPAPRSAPLADALKRLADDGEPHPFAVIAIEVDDVERLQAADAIGAARAVSAIERAAVSVAPGAAMIVRERPGRLWIVATGTGRIDGRALAERVVEASETAAVLRRAPLTVSVGLAIAPEDAADADALAAVADESLFAARSAGLRLV